MSGIALIIPGADYGQTSLGKVTFKKTASEEAEDVVNAFELATGVTGHHDDLFDFVKTLIDEAVWDNLDGVYPMLGSTSSAVLYNLKGENSIALKVLENATIGEGKITFANNIAVSAPTLEDYDMGYSPNRLVFLRAKFIKSSVNSNVAYSDSVLVEVSTPYYSNLGFCSLLQTQGLKNGVGVPGSSLISYNNDVIATTTPYMSLLEHVGEGDTAKTVTLMVDGVVADNIGTTTFPSDYKMKPHNTLGIYYGKLMNEPFSEAAGTIVSATDKIFNGEINFFASGHIAYSKITAFNTAVEALLTSLGK